MVILPKKANSVQILAILLPYQAVTETTTLATVALHRIGQPIVAERAAGTFARDILSRFLIDLSWTSSRLEGNTYSRLDTERLIQFGQEAEGKDAKETQMVLNHKAAIQLLVQETTDDIGMNRYTLLNLHSLLSDNLMADPEASGSLRRRPVDISGSVYTPPAVPQVIEECFTLMLTKASAIASSCIEPDNDR